MGWNCPVCLNGDLASLTHQQASPPSLQFRPPPTNMFSCNGFISTSPFTPSSSQQLITFFLLSLYLPHHHRPQAHNQSTTHSHTLNELHVPLKTLDLRILQWNVGSLSPSRRAELIAFLSNNQYDLILLQGIHLSATKKFQIPEFARQGPVSSGAHNTGGGVLTLIHSDLAFSPVFVSSLSSQDPYSDNICANVLFSNHSPLQFLNLYSPPIRSTPDSRTKTFSPGILPNSPDTFILGDFNAHHPTWDSLFPTNPPGNDLFRWITSSGLEILNDPPLSRSSIIPLGAVHPPIFC